MEYPGSPSSFVQENSESEPETYQDNSGDCSEDGYSDDGLGASIIRPTKKRSASHGQAAVTAIQTPNTHARRQGKQSPVFRSRPTSSTPSSNTPSRLRSITVTPSFRTRVTTPGNNQKQDCNCQDVVLKKIRDIEHQNKAILDKLDMVLTSQKERSKSKKVDVPAHIKAAVHDGYKCGLEEKNLKWIHKDRSGKCLKYISTENNETTDQVVTFTKGMYPTAEEGVIHFAVETYFESVRQRDLKEAAGKTEAHRRTMTLYNRRMRKLKFRKSALKAKRSYDEAKKQKISSALTMDFMSSEEENQSDEETFIIKDLLWRSEEMKKIVMELDEKWMTMQSSKSKKQTCKRIRLETAVSSHGPPSKKDNLEWALK